MCFNPNFKGEEGDLELNECGKKGSSHSKTLKNYQQEMDHPPEQLPEVTNQVEKKNEL